jgi:hypothetical protein
MIAKKQTKVLIILEKVACLNIMMNSGEILLNHTPCTKVKMPMNQIDNIQSEYESCTTHNQLYYISQKFNSA